MHISEIDRWCDNYEERLRAGDVLSVQEFIQANGLSQVAGLIAELERVEREYRCTHVPAVPPGPTVTMPPDASIAKTIGPYKLLQKLGEGGMGVVYMAEQSKPVARRVALKIIKPGMDSKQVLARFDAERQALALMDHPNIARVLDAGLTADGRPYFVMELVKGVPITKYCDEKRLTPKERLELFVPICQAVQHAHHKGVIHRDLTPRNVLVAELDGRPVPKVIDFGLAKAVGLKLTDETMFTEIGQTVGTPAYMSPEQASFNQLDVDTRTDVYSLGVLLYELLTGETPLDRKRLQQVARDEFLRLVREEDPPKPSTRLSSHASLPTIAANRRTEPRKLGLLVRGELDWIVMKALEKERSRRYQTPSDLGLDVSRFLHDEAVAAGPPSPLYRIRKLLRRNKTAATATAIVLGGLLVAAGSVGWAIKDRADREAAAEQEKENRIANHSAQVELILDEVFRLEEEHEWSMALLTARRANELIAAGEMRGTKAEEEVNQALRELSFVQRLEQIRFNQVLSGWYEVDFAETAKAYLEAFGGFGVNLEGLTADDAFSVLRRSPRIAVPVAEALDHWSYAVLDVNSNSTVTSDSLSAIARDLDPDSFRNLLRSIWTLPKAVAQAELIKMIDDFKPFERSPGSCDLFAAAAYYFDVEYQGGSGEHFILQKAVVFHADDFYINYALAEHFYQKQQYENAARYLTAAVALRPEEAALHELLSVVLFNLNENTDAGIRFDRAIELNPDYPDTYNGRAWFLVACPDESRWNPHCAIALAEYAIELAAEASDGSDMEIDADEPILNFYNTLGVAHYRAGNWGEAIEALLTCEQKRRDELDHLFLSMAHWKLGNRDEAIFYFDSAVELMNDGFDSSATAEELRRFQAEAADLIGAVDAP